MKKSKRSIKEIVICAATIAAGAATGIALYKFGFKKGIALAENNLVLMMDGIEDHFIEKAYDFVKDDIVESARMNNIFDYITERGVEWGEEKISFDLLNKAITFEKNGTSLCKF